VPKFHQTIDLFRNGLLLKMLAPLSFCYLSITASAQTEFPRSAQRCYEMGEAFLEKREWSNAHAAFDACLQNDAYFADAYYARGLAREHLNEWPEALTDYNIYLEWKPDHVEARFNRAQLRFRLEQYELARQDFITLLQQPPGETTTVFFRQDAFSGAVNQVFTAQGANKAYLFNYLGLTETQLNHIEAAVASFDSALRFVPDADVYVNRGIALEKMTRPDDARKDYQTALKLNAHHALAKHNLGALEAKGKKPEALKLLDEAIEDNPKLPYAYAERGYARWENGDYENALMDYNEAIRIDSSQADYFLNRGLVHEKLNHHLAAYRDYTRAVNLNEKLEKAWLSRGNLLTRLNRLSEAIDDYTIALIFHPTYATACYNRALAYQRLGQLRKACTDLLRAEELKMEVPARLKKQVCEKE
jgi:tetratricopeptide (TPR) repeat protein